MQKESMAVCLAKLANCMSLSFTSWPDILDKNDDACEMATNAWTTWALTDLIINTYLLKNFFLSSKNITHN